MTKIIELIYTESFRGIGSQDDICRNVPQLFTKDGVLIAEQDVCRGTMSFNGEELRAILTATR